MASDARDIKGMYFLVDNEGQKLLYEVQEAGPPEKLLLGVFHNCIRKSGMFHAAMRQYDLNAPYIVISHMGDNMYQWHSDWRVLDGFIEGFRNITRHGGILPRQEDHITVTCILVSQEA